MVLAATALRCTRCVMATHSISYVLDHLWTRMHNTLVHRAKLRCVEECIGGSVFRNGARIHFYYEKLIVGKSVHVRTGAVCISESLSSSFVS